MIARLAGLIDGLASRLVVEPRFVSRRASERLAWLSERLTAIRQLDEADWFAAPGLLVPRVVAEGRYRGQPTKTIRWDPPEIAACRSLEMLPRSGPPEITRYGFGRRKVWVLIHGWLGGAVASDRRLWPIDRLLEDHDVVQVTLPGHGKRRCPLNARWPTFPARNPIANAVGLATATAELRQLVRWLRHSDYREIGIAATSLGANILALYATVENDCERLVLDRPAARMSEPVRRVAQRRGGEAGTILKRLEAIYAPVSPLMRDPRVDAERIQILLGRRDGIVGVEGGEALARHFGVTPEWFAGGHVLALGRQAALGRTLLACPAGQAPTRPMAQKRSV